MNARAAAWLACLALAGCAGAPPAPAPPALERAAALLAGRFDSTEQAARDPRYLPISLVMVPIWAGRADGRWFYVEQALLDTPRQPYRQRVYRLREGDGGELVSEVYQLPDPDRYVHAWETGALDGLAPEALEARPGCEVYLRPDGVGFRGGTRGQDCASGLRGARWASAEVRLGAGGLASWDRGFAADGRQAWGAEAGPYEFRRR